MFYGNIWKPVKGITFDFENWGKKCNSNKHLLFFSIAFVMYDSNDMHYVVLSHIKMYLFNYDSNNALLCYFYVSTF